MPLPAIPTSSPASDPAWIRRAWETPWAFLWIAGALIAVMLFAGLGDTDFDNDETLNAFAVETLLADGDWLTLKDFPSASRPFLEKPPLKIWISALPVRLGWLPANEFGLRWMDALAGAAALLYVFAIGRRLAGPVCGLTAVVLLLSQAAVIFEHGLRSTNMESVLVLSYCAGIYHFLAWRSINPDVKRHVYAMALAFVLGFMAKSVAALFLPAILALAALATRDNRGRLYRDWRTFALAALLTIGLIAPWFVYQAVVRGPDLVSTMFRAHVVQRLTASLDPAHLQPWQFYATDLWEQLERSGTRALVIAGALLLLARLARRRWLEGALVVLWFALPMVVISAATSKLSHYAYPFLPPVALAGGYAAALGAEWLDRAFARPFAALDRWRRRLLLGPVRSTRLQIALTAAGLTAALVTLTTALFGRLAVTLGDLDLRNSSAVRPGLAAGLALLTGAPTRILRGVAVAALIAWVLPLPALQANLSQTTRGTAPWRTLRDCLAPIAYRLSSEGELGRGVLVDGILNHVPHYYLRGLGPWQRLDAVTSETIVAQLYTPDLRRPVLVTRERFQDLLLRLNTDEGLLDRAASQGGVDPQSLRDEARGQTVGVTTAGQWTLLIPGPLQTCATDRLYLPIR